MGHEVSVTSLLLAQLGSVIANGGILVHPRIVAWEREPGGKKVKLSQPQAQRALRPETVLTMQRLMRRVLLPGGTAQRLKVPGYAIAGKTGTAQVFDFAHHMYTHKYNASFLGFGPLENPKLVVVVTISPTTGESGFGGAASGPVFEAVTQKAMERLGIPRDMPQDIEDLIAKDKEAKQKEQQKGKKQAAKDVDDTALAALNPPTEEEMQQASGGENITDPNAPKVPNFVGKTVRDVMQEAAASGLDVDLFGDGMARAQTPLAGAALVPGEHISVRFAR